jgi:hypothetical protein
MSKFVIPSFQRSEQLKNKTLRYLSSHNVPNESIYIFTRVDDNNLSSYVKLRDEGYNVVVLVDVKGIGMTHNAITKHFDEGEFIIEIDDDMTDLLNHKRESIQDFSEVCEIMKAKLIETGLSYGGTYAFDNPKFQTNCKEFTTDLRYMLGCIRFRFVRKDIILETNYAEDFENCILHCLRDGGILKNNWIAPRTRNYAHGGCAADGRDNDSEKNDKEYLANKYPSCAKLFQRKSGVWDLRIKMRKLQTTGHCYSSQN